MKKIAIDLTWVRHGKVGGTESYIVNILEGLYEINPDDYRFVLLVSKDNSCFFKKYADKSCFEVIDAGVLSVNQRERVIWQNTKLGRLIKSLGIEVCWMPIYSKPFFGVKGIKFITTIHDFQAMHYPKYFSFARVLWMKVSWFWSIYTSKYIVSISNYVKKDLLSHYKVRQEKVRVIYNAISLENKFPQENMLEKYGLEDNDYYYTVSSLLPHKNLETLILALAELKRKKSAFFSPLVVSGVGGSSKDKLNQIIIKNDLSGDVIFTDFVKNEERNFLYSKCRAFLFPSIFEGFGMPPIEAMAMGAYVVTTKCTSLYEVTQGLVNYVESPQDPICWCKMLESRLVKPDNENIKRVMSLYSKEEIASQYIELFDEMFK